MTKTADEFAGTRAVLEGGEVLSVEDAGCPNGTTLLIRDLFYNTPARMKFLKSDRAEGSAVALIADRIALSHPEISVRFIKDGKEQMCTPGNGDLHAAQLNPVARAEFLRAEHEVHRQKQQARRRGQQQSLEQRLTDTPVTGSVPKYNLPRGANTGNVGSTTHFGYQTVNSEEKAQKVAEVFHSVASLRWCFFRCPMGR